jgi:hypothetical protein
MTLAQMIQADPRMTARAETGRARPSRLPSACYGWSASSWQRPSPARRRFERVDLSVLVILDIPRERPRT